MKNKKYELFRRKQQQYHRNHPWTLSRGGLYIPHCYKETSPDSLSWWDDVGFILNGRRVIVWWQHPRHVYANSLEEHAWMEAGPGPRDAWLLEDAETNYRRVGASRKKVVSYTCRAPSDEQKAHYNLLQAIHQRLMREGIDLEVTPSWTLTRMNWAMGIHLVAPLEVRNETELEGVTALARRLMVRSTTLEDEFRGYHYSRANWVNDRMTSSRP